MSKVKLIFSILVIIITVLVIVYFLGYEINIRKINYNSVIMGITDYSEGAYFYRDPEMKIPVSINDLDFRKNQNIMTPQHVSLEILFSDLFINIHPLSFIRFSSSKKNLSLNKGEFYWERIKNGKTSVNVLEEVYNVNLSGKGRLIVSPNGKLTIWNYNGVSNVKSGSGDFELLPERIYFFTNKGLISSEEIPSSPEFIVPNDEKIYLEKVRDANVRFECKSVPNASGYSFKLYGSSLGENILAEKKTVANRTTINLAEFGKKKVFFWNVFPLNKNNIEGEPSVTGRIRLFGSILSENMNLQPPEIDIISLTVNGNLVLIKGQVLPDSTLFIDEVPVPLEQDGSFIYTKSFKSMGLKTISFRVISASEVENTITRQVTIFEE